MKIVVMIPTYNERHNIEQLINEILNLNLNLEIKGLVKELIGMAQLYVWQEVMI